MASDCPISDNWSKCEIFNDHNNSKVIAIPKNEAEQAGYWQNSMEICKKYNASLVAIESEEKTLIFQSFLGLFGNDTSKRAYWTSGHKDSSGKFRWSNNGNELNYTNWFPTEPNNINGDEDCISTYLSLPKWVDISCGRYLVGVVCEFSLNI